MSPPVISTWKGFERRVAKYFSITRTPSSGPNSKISASDSLHPKIYSESKSNWETRQIELYYDVKRNNRDKLIMIFSMADLDSDYENKNTQLWVHSSDFHKLLRKNYNPFHIEEFSKDNSIFAKFINEYKRDKTRSEWSDSDKKAKIESKILMLTLSVKNKKGFFVVQSEEGIKSLMENYREQEVVSSDKFNEGLKLSTIETTRPRDVAIPDGYYIAPKNSGFILIKPWLEELEEKFSDTKIVKRTKDFKEEWVLWSKKKKPLQEALDYLFD